MISEADLSQPCTFCRLYVLDGVADCVVAKRRVEVVVGTNGVHDGAFPSDRSQHRARENAASKETYARSSRRHCFSFSHTRRCANMGLVKVSRPSYRKALSPHPVFR